jgi:hypothetical protein
MVRYARWVKQARGDGSQFIVPSGDRVENKSQLLNSKFEVLYK